MKARVPADLGTARAKLASLVRAKAASERRAGHPAGTRD